MIETIRAYQQNYLNTLKSSYKRYFYKKIDTTSKLIGILGARGVGKTTFLLQYFKESKIDFDKKLYFSADLSVVTSLLDVAVEFNKIGGRLLLIDEVHKIKNFEIELKQIYDMFDIQVIFSGSSALAIDNSKADLSRRAIIYEVNGLSFREFIELKSNVKLPSYSLEEILKNHSEISYSILSKIKPFEYFQSYLKYGYYPFYFEDKNTYLKRLNETINTVIEVDIPTLFSIDYDKIINLKKLVNLVCKSKPFKINAKELSRKIGINDYHTLYKYIHYLSRAKILTTIKQKSKGDLIFVKPDKLYLNNTNLYYANCLNSEIGTIRETFFASMLSDYEIYTSKKGDFLVNDYIFEIGGKSKDFKQIKDIKNSFVVADDIEIGFKNKIPLWLFGFLY